MFLYSPYSSLAFCTRILIASSLFSKYPRFIFYSAGMQRSNCSILSVFFTGSKSWINKIVLLFIVINMVNAFFGLHHCFISFNVVIQLLCGYRWSFRTQLQYLFLCCYNIDYFSGGVLKNNSIGGRSVFWGLDLAYRFQLCNVLFDFSLNVESLILILNDIFIL